MKKLFLVLFTLVFIGCGAAPPECECEDIAHCFEETKDTFFETYYAECLNACISCEKWYSSCFSEAFDTAICTESRWYGGETNGYCKDLITRIEALVSDNDCDESTTTALECIVSIN